MDQSFNLRKSVVVISILAALCLLKHPYYGIWHDGVGYTFLALKHLYPHIFANDLFSKFWMQDNYTIFPRIYAGLINAFGIYKSALLLTIAGQLLWVFAAVTLFRIFLQDKKLYIALAIVFFIKAGYGGFNCLQYAEIFVNPRIFSEALCIFGVSCLLKQRNITSFVFFLISFFVHPLMTLCSILIAYIYLVLTYPRFLFSAPILVAAVLLLGLFKIEPLTGLFRIMPTEWYEITKSRSSFMFLSQWPLISWTSLFYTISITSAACLFSDGFLRRLFLASMIGACCGMLISFVGGELFRIEFLMQIQIWRVLWFLQFISALGTAVIIINILEQENNKLLFCCFFILTYYSSSLGMISFGVSLIFFYLCVRISRQDIISFNMLRPSIFGIMFVTIIIVMILSYMISPIGIFIKSDFNTKLLAPLVESIPLTLFSPLILCPVIFFLYYFGDKKISIKIAFLSFVILIFSLAVWDRQSSWSKTLERNEDETAFFRNVLPSDATILWDGSAANVWFGARRKSYISAIQGAGVVYNQESSLEYAKRINLILPLTDENPFKSKDIVKRQMWQLDEINFKPNYTTVCRNAEELDYIVSTENIPGESIAHWRSTVPQVKMRNGHDGTSEMIKYYDFYLYDCNIPRKVR